MANNKKKSEQLPGSDSTAERNARDKANEAARAKERADEEKRAADAR